MADFYIDKRISFLIGTKNTIYESLHHQMNKTNYLNNINISYDINNNVSISSDNVTKDNFYSNAAENVTILNPIAENVEHVFTWSDMCLIIVFSVFIVITIIGNTLVILAVITTRRLRTVTNCFVMSLAIADLLVGIFVMPPAVAVHLIGYWQLGWILCDIWISLDVLLCTASILSLCAISIDRYLAVTRPLTYSRKRRSKRLALTMILIVWILALAITCPPILGWYEPGRRDDVMECRYNQNEGYVVFSAMGSFFIPMAVMIYVYARISCVVASRHDNITNLEIHNKKCKRFQRPDVEFELEPEPDQDTSEQENSSPKHRRVPSQRQQQHHPQKVSTARNSSTLSFDTDVKETTFNDNNVQARQQHCRNGNNYESTIHNKRASSFKVPSSQTGKSTQSDTWSLGHRYSVKHNANTNANAITEINVTRVHQKSISNRITSLKRESKTTQTLSIVMGGFIACWLPFFIYYLITPFVDEKLLSPVIAKFLTWLGWFNSAINPFIYAFYSVDFRAAFWRLTFKRFFKNPSKVQFPSNTLSIRR